MYKYQFIAKSQMVAFGDSRLLPTLQMDANQCRSMCDLQRLSRTAFLHLSVPLSSERQLNLLGDMVCSANQLFYSWLVATCVNFIPNSEGSIALFLSVVCPMLLVCRSAVHCLNSQRAVLLLQDTRREGTFACTHTSIVTCTSAICLLYWLGTCVNFIPNSEGSVALFLSVVCPMRFCN
jgi:hypothetical protein